MTDLIYHLARRDDLDAAEKTGQYQGSAEDLRDGFLHFSSAAQICESARRHRAGEADLILIEVAAPLLGDSLVWEVSRSGQKFPHLYGPVPLNAITRRADLPIGPDGQHVFPSWL